MRRAFELDAARDDVPLAEGGTAFGLELVIFDGTTLDLFNCPELAAEFGVPEGGRHPSCGWSHCCRQGRCGGRPPPIGGYHDGENALADQLEGALGPGQLSLADRGFFSMGRWLRFSAAGAHLLWRVKNAARSVPFRQLRTLKDGSELVLLRESGGMLGKRRRDAGDQAPVQAAGHRRPPGLLHHPDPHPPRQGEDRRDPRADHPAGPGRLPRAEIAALYAARWQVETAFFT